jgi:hypothetical protein
VLGIVEVEQIGVVAAVINTTASGACPLFSTQRAICHRRRLRRNWSASA